MKYCIFGGSFDPPHEGHRHLARAAAESLHLDKVFWVPAQDPPLKSKPSTPFAHRVAMTRLASSDMPGHEVSDIEGRLPTPSYSLRTIRSLKAEHGRDHAWHFLIGADNWAVFPSWHGPEDVLKEVTLVVYPRSGFTLGVLPPGVVGLPLGEFNAASRTIRASLATGSLFGLEHVPAPVQDYIRENRLYPSGNPGSDRP